MARSADVKGLFSLLLCGLILLSPYPASWVAGDDCLAITGARGRMEEMTNPAGHVTTYEYTTGAWERSGEIPQTRGTRRAT